MERIIYRKTLDVHKNGIQFMLQGFQTADNLSRVIEISLMASGDAIDFPLERIEAMMYITTPDAVESSINRCTIKDNKVVYEVLPIVEEGITTMQLKIIETSPEGAKSVLASPEFAVEVTKSSVDDESAEQTTTFTALEDAVAKAKTVYDERFLRMELDSQCVFKAWYADGTYYETDLLKRLFMTGNALLSESFAKGGTGVRSGEDTDNSKYYSNIAKSEAVNAKDIMTNSEEILEYVRLHGVYTAFSVNYETGEVEYVSPSFKFNINMETGELDAIGQTYSFNDEVGRIVEEWLEANHININTLQDISLTHSGEIKELQELTENHSAALNSPRPIRLGGTGAVTAREAIENLGATQIINGSYVGTGTYGENNPNTLTFVDENGDAVIPKVVMIGCIGNHRPPAIYYWGNPGFSMVSSMISLNAGSSSFNNNAFYDYPNVVGINDNTMTWFCRNSESAQLNASGSTYYFLALI